ncbi:MAG: hypothetical protein A2X49_01425 [Lentisphaerae bacterium GWF2_52_8]|nr:MAG: hypothetical protein A2X49_01425 [Lentisphaerae bacterium GWF2_52_8]
MVRIGRHCLKGLRAVGRALLMAVQAFCFIPLFYKGRAEISRQMYVAGLCSVGVTSAVALMTGMILCLQTGLFLRDYGQEMRVGTLVAQAMCREMGPLMTALILAASVGSAMAAQLGTMAVSEEVAALEVMSINPVRFLVMPRLLAMLFMCPVLTVYTNIIGILGGGLVASTQLDVAWAAYYDNVLFMLHAKEIWIGVIKALIFAVIIVTIACFQGFSAREGAVGVGNATRKTVVFSFLSILITGYFVTRLMYD